MTDDELERALFALPLEEPPIDLHARILAATIDRPQLTFTTWEVWVVGTLVACMVWLAFSLATSAPDAGGAIARILSSGIDRFTAAISFNALIWSALGASLVVWVSQLSLPSSRRKIAGR